MLERTNLWWRERNEHGRLVARWTPLAAALACVVVSTAWTRATVAAEPSAADLEFFEKSVRPLLADHCLQCHSEAKKVKGGLRLDLASGWLKGAIPARL